LKFENGFAAISSRVLHQFQYFSWFSIRYIIVHPNFSTVQYCIEDGSFRDWRTINNNITKFFRPQGKQQISWLYHRALGCDSTRLRDSSAQSLLCASWTMRKPMRKFLTVPFINLQFSWVFNTGLLVFQYENKLYIPF
jgi:hypothetical protein